jgi:DNA-binding CsgD family transcriptional regulator
MNLGDPLSEREADVMKHLATGMFYKEIGEILKISPETVQKHTDHIYYKLDVNNRVRAINNYYNRK